MGFLRHDDRRELLVIADESKVFALEGEGKDVSKRETKRPERMVPKC